ncbi:MAG: arginyl aminopeptidase, partial [Cytophagales bacterium]
MRKFYTLVILSIPIFANAQDATVSKYAGIISELELKDNLSILASDALEGRETGTRGQKMAAAFISNYFS